MKIINMKTNIVFDLPQKDALKILEENPTLFSKGSKPVKKKTIVPQEDTILLKIIDR